ncbi:MAG: hypothetical protein RLY86_3252 [Pseudomonadota bacterium]
MVVVAYDGLCTFEFGIAVEVFGLPRPEMGPDWYHCTVVAAESGPMRALGGVQITAEENLDLIRQAGTIVLPGWRSPTDPVPEALVSALRDAHAAGARLVSICSGVFAIAATGLLSGREATTHWRYAELLTARYPDIRFVPDVLYVDHGRLMTSAGSAAGLDLCLHIVRRDFGADAANRVARRLVVPAHRDGGQPQVIERPVPAEREGKRLSPLLDHMRRHLDQDHALRDLADRAGMSLRTFLRRFRDMTGTTPGEWLLRERVERAAELLRGTDAGIEDIATACGFPTAAALRYHVRTRFGTTPSRLRRDMGAPPAGPDPLT